MFDGVEWKRHDGELTPEIAEVKPSHPLRLRSEQRKGKERKGRGREGKEAREWENVIRWVLKTFITQWLAVLNIYMQERSETGQRRKKGSSSRRRESCVTTGKQTEVPLPLDG